MTIKNSFKQLPNEKGYFGSFGGRYVSETLMPLILEVEKEYDKTKSDKDFKKELDHVCFFLNTIVVASLSSLTTVGIYLNSLSLPI